MVPIYDSDLAEDRWSKAEWSHYELWEKVDSRIRKHKRLWIAGTVVVFLLLSSIPVITEQLPKWKTLSATRKLAQRINWLKVEAAVERSAYRIRFVRSGEGGGLGFEVERASHCNSAVFTPVLSDSLSGEDRSLALMTREEGRVLNIPRLLDSFCYDPVAGSDLGAETGVIAVIPANDLAVGRMDRLSALFLTGPSTDLTFE